MARQPTGPGRVRRHTDLPDYQHATLWNFDFDWHELKQPHRDYLDDKVVPILERGGSLTLYGHTSRMGTDEYNLDLSRRRVAAVLAYLTQHVQRSFQYNLSGTGEALARAEGVSEPTTRPPPAHEAWYRSVVVVASMGTPPPPPPPPPPPEPDPDPEPSESRFKIRLVRGRLRPRSDFYEFEVWDTVNDPQRQNTARYEIRATSWLPAKRGWDLTGGNNWTSFTLRPPRAIDQLGGRASVVFATVGQARRSPESRAPHPTFLTLTVKNRGIDVRLRVDTLEGTGGGVTGHFQITEGNLTHRP